MNFEIKETGQRLTDREIAAYEAGAKVRLPPQYRSFLKRINGFISLVMIGPNNGLDADLSGHFPLFSDSIRCPTKTVECVNDLIWFGVDSGGGRFGLAHSGQNFGKIFWFDLPHSNIVEPTSADCVFVAETFNAFIEGLVEIN